jgi:mRNA-degrading endonuclease RelE of RelBE toxin-antitoxin system
VTFGAKPSEHLRKSLRILKNLRHDLSHLKRVRIGSYVLVFKVVGNVIVFDDFDHHVS